MPAIDFPNSPTNGQEFTSGLQTWVYDGTKWNSKAVNAYSNESAPIGTIVNFAGPSNLIPAGWIACNGNAISRTTYATLFSVIGTTYGAGDGSTSFTLPTINSTTGIFIIRWTTTLGTSSTHASLHIRGGTDIVDGDRLQVDYVPTAYTRNSAATGAGATTDLTAHLAGIDGLFGAWTAYTPTWTSDSGTPSIGNGSIGGRYKQMGKIVLFNLKLTYGTTTTGGSGAWMFGLPVTAYNSNYQFPVSILNDGLAWYGAIANGNYKNSTSYFSVIHQNDTATTIWGGVTSTAPFSFGNGDTLTVSGSYEAA